MRPTICFTERSRSGEAMRPRKYFCATMFVAVCDQKRGNSTSLCSNAGPSLPGISASRSSHSTSSNGSRPGMVKNRRGATLASPFTTVFTYSCAASGSAVASVGVPVASLAVAILFLPSRP